MSIASTSSKFGLIDLLISSSAFLEKTIIPYMSALDVSSSMLTSKAVFTAFCRSFYESRSFQYENFDRLKVFYNKAVLSIHKDLDYSFKARVFYVFWHAISKLTKTSFVDLPIDASVLDSHLDIHVDFDNFLPLVSKGQSIEALERKLLLQKMIFSKLAETHDLKEISEQMLLRCFEPITLDEAESFFSYALMQDVFPGVLQDVIPYIPRSVLDLPGRGEGRAGALFQMSKHALVIANIEKKIQILLMSEKTQALLRQKVTSAKEFVLSKFRSSLDLGVMPRLSLDHCKITLVSSDLLKLKFNFYQLNNNQLSEVPLCASPELVTYLNLSDNPITDFANLDSYSNLIKLNMSNTGLRRFPKINNLRQINFSSNRLISLPESIIDIEDIYIYDNPFIYIPPKVLTYLNSSMMSFSAKDIPVSRNVNHFWEELCYEPKTTLGRLFKQFIREEKEYDKEAIEHELSQLKKEYSDDIYGCVWRESGSPFTIDIQWGQHHALDDLSLLALSVRSFILNKLSQMQTERQGTIYRNIALLSGYYVEMDLEDWGREHCYDCLVKLCDAIYLLEEDIKLEISHSTTSMHFAMGLIKRCYFLKEVVNHFHIDQEDIIFNSEIGLFYIRPVYDILEQYESMTGKKISELPLAVQEALEIVDPYVKRWHSSLV